MGFLKFVRDKSILASVIAGIYAFANFSGFHRKKRWEKFTKWDYAHRGLHDRKAGIPENSMAAFERAVRHGYGIELDVRMTADGHLVIMHDDSLLRMCGTDRRVSQMTLHELQPFYLDGTKEKIPLLKDVLKLVDGKVPLLIEIKADHFEQKKLCPRLWSFLSGYQGDFFVESFNPLVVQWFWFHHPEIVRGQLSCDFFKEKPHADLVLFVVTNLMTNFMTHPDFISYKYIDTAQLSFQLNKRVYRSMTALWTIRSRKSYEKYKDTADIMIFEGFLP